jgi:hypothetical protein
LLFGERLFDAETYFDTALRALASCERKLNADIVSRGVAVQGSWHSWELIVWRVTITFTSGHVLEILESHEKKMRIKHYRKAKYHFMDADRKCIFRVDTHKDSIPFDDPCHLHFGEHETIEDGDPRLRGQSLIGIDFLTVFSWVHQYLEGKPLIWQQP